MFNNNQGFKKFERSTDEVKFIVNFKEIILGEQYMKDLNVIYGIEDYSYMNDMECNDSCKSNDMEVNEFLKEKLKIKD